ncbi:hypothetical protein ACWCYZ_45995 [Streptomyces virginiae]
MQAILPSALARFIPGGGIDQMTFAGHLAQGDPLATTALADFLAWAVAADADADRAGSHPPTPGNEQHQLTDRGSIFNQAARAGHDSGSGSLSVPGRGGSPIPRA